MSTPAVAAEPSQQGNKSAQPAAKSAEGPAACARCKAQKKGAIACREGGKRGGGHNLHEYPPTTLTQPMCIDLLAMRGKKFPQYGIQADQRYLEEAMQAGMANGRKDAYANVSEALERLKLLELKEYLESAQAWRGTENAISQHLEIFDQPDVEWQLSRWGEPPSGVQYALSEKFLCREDGITLLWHDPDFNEHLMREITATTPAHVTTTLCAVARSDDALNCSKRVCPSIMDWLMQANRGEEDWRCLDNEDEKCDFQHDCGGGLKCDVDGCVLFHPNVDTRWMVLIDKTSAWAEAMTFDEANAFKGEDGARMRALDDLPNCTNTEVWRASFPALAFGRTKIPTTITPAAAASPAPGQPTASRYGPASDPVLAADEVGLSSAKQRLTLKGPGGAPAPAATKDGNKEADAAASEASAKDEKPADAAAGENTGDSVPTEATGDNAPDAIAENAAKEEEPTDAAAAAAAKLLTDPAKRVAGTTVTDGILVEDQEETLDADSPPATASPSKKTKAADEAKAPTTGGDEVAAEAEKVAEQPEQGRRKRRRVDVLSAQGQQLIVQARAHLATGMSGKYQEVLKRAAKLSPTERAALLTALANMIQQDQAKSLQLLEQSIVVAEHFTAENFTSKPSK